MEQKQNKLNETEVRRKQGETKAKKYVYNVSYAQNLVTHDRTDS